MTTPGATTLSTPSSWDDDPAGASLLIATGRARHNMLVMSEHTFLIDLFEAWGTPESSIRSSFLPGVSAPTAPGHCDQLRSYERDGLTYLIAQGFTTAYEGKAVRRVNAIPRLAAAGQPDAAVIVVRATSLGEAPIGSILPVADHLMLAPHMVPTDINLHSVEWNKAIRRAAQHTHAAGPDVIAALWAGAVKPGHAESRVLISMGADIVIHDGLPQALTLMSAGVPVLLLAVVDSVIPAQGLQLAEDTGVRGRDDEAGSVPTPSASTPTPHRGGRRVRRADVVGTGTSTPINGSGLTIPVDHRVTTILEGLSEFLLKNDSRFASDRAR
ncbi:hypothetical protein [Actinomyces vulturis]|uniref:hypothetical protein n=1 Tax=Actinomyces vulturis TaxID=1857645 RepID=UPI000833DF33|nr:hypothetical protein [Actinomyces vulturis]